MRERDHKKIDITESQNGSDDFSYNNKIMVKKKTLAAKKANLKVLNSLLFEI